MQSNNPQHIRRADFEERAPKSASGLGMLILNSLLILAACALFVFGILWAEDGATAAGVVAAVVGGVYAFLVGPLLYAGLKSVRPNEAMVLTLFGRYHGTLREAGYYYVNPFATAMRPPMPVADGMEIAVSETSVAPKAEGRANKVTVPSKKLSLKTMTLNNERQKINDKLGNPIIIGIVVIWHVQDTVKAMFNVDNYVEFLSIQCDSALRNIVRMYPYDCNDDVGEGNEKSLRGSSVEIAQKLAAEIQDKVAVAGLVVEEARITHLAYAPEIAAAMLQRQQASAIVDARQLIVDGAVGMVEMALAKLSENGVVELDEERKAAMVSNLMVVLCGNRDAQPVVNSGSLY